jgi:stage II sporulation protein D
MGKATVSAPEFRLAIGSTKLKSTLIDSIVVTGDKVTFKGKGYGHGVGMSQWGAKGRAEQGAKAEDIINAYFRGIEVFKIWD